MVHRIALLLVFLCGIAGCSKESGAAGQPNEKRMEIPKGLPGGPPGNPQKSIKPKG